MQTTHELSFGQLISEINNKIRLFTHKEAKNQNLTPIQWQVLNFIEQHGGNLTQYKLAQLMNRDLGQLTRLLNNLEKQNLIRKAVDKNDKRMRHIMLTNQAKEKISPIKTAINNFHNLLKDNIDPCEYSTLINTLSKLKLCE